MEKDLSNKNYKVLFYIYLICAIIITFSTVYVNVFKEKHTVIYNETFKCKCKHDSTCNVIDTIIK